MKIHLTIDNQHIDEQSFFLNQAMHDKSTMEFDGQSVDNKKALKSDQNEGSLNLIKTWNEVEEPEEAMVSHPVSMSEAFLLKVSSMIPMSGQNRVPNFLSMKLKHKAMVSEVLFIMLLLIRRNHVAFTIFR